METRCPPGLYLDPPDFDIELGDFARLPLCRLEAFRLLREGQASKVSDESLERKALTAGKRARGRACRELEKIHARHSFRFYGRNTNTYPIITADERPMPLDFICRTSSHISQL